MKMEVQWPEVFTNSHFVYGSDDSDKLCAVADGLIGWGNCCAGNKPPEGFGKGMVEVSRRIGSSALPENLHALAEKTNDLK